MALYSLLMQDKKKKKKKDKKSKKNKKAKKETKEQKEKRMEKDKKKAEKEKERDATKKKNEALAKGRKALVSFGWVPWPNKWAIYVQDDFMWPWCKTLDLTEVNNPLFWPLLNAHASTVRLIWETVCLTHSGFGPCLGWGWFLQNELRADGLNTGPHKTLVSN